MTTGISGGIHNPEYGVLVSASSVCVYDTRMLTFVILQKEIVSAIFSPKLNSVSVKNFTYRDVQPYYLPKVNCLISS